MNAPRALIAEDEPVLAEALRRHLAQLWPELQVTHLVGDGQQLVELASRLLPDILFLDIHMPVLNGLDAAEHVVDAWPHDRPLPLVVFITAYDHHAVRAFERAAIDYVLKPVRPERLALTCMRLQQQLARREPPAPVHEDALSAHLIDLRTAPGGAEAEAPLRVLQAAAGSSVYLIPVEDIVYLEASDKYVRVITATQADHAPDWLIRTPLRELVHRLDASLFWQVHRSHVVNVRAVERVSRQEHRTRLHLRQRPEVLEVSRLYAHRFKAM